MLLLVRAFFPSSAGETSEKEQEERPSSNLLPQAGEGKKLKSAPMRLCGNDAWGLRRDDSKGRQLSYNDIFLSSTRICASPRKMSLWDKDVAIG
jgi:hypothetical protein